MFWAKIRPRPYLGGHFSTEIAQAEIAVMRCSDEATSSQSLMKLKIGDTLLPLEMLAYSLVGLFRCGSVDLTGD